MINYGLLNSCQKPLDAMHKVIYNIINNIFTYIFVSCNLFLFSGTSVVDGFITQLVSLSFAFSHSLTSARSYVRKLQRSFSPLFVPCLCQTVFYFRLTYSSSLTDLLERSSFTPKYRRKSDDLTERFYLRTTS